MRYNLGFLAAAFLTLACARHGLMVQDPDGTETYCDREADSLRVTVRNPESTASAPGWNLTVQFAPEATYAPATQPIPSVPPNGTLPLLTPFPTPNCFTPDCSFRISLTPPTGSDFTGHRVDGRCIG